MANQTVDRKINERFGTFQEPEVATAEKFQVGSLVFLNAAGYAVRPDNGGLQCIGMCDAPVDNTLGGNGPLRVHVKTGVFAFDPGSSTQLPTRADIGRVVYAIDDHTIGRHDAAGTLPPAGVLFDIDSEGYYFVAVGLPGEALRAIAGGMVAEIEVVTLVGTNTYNTIAPISGKVEKVMSIINGALTTGDATLTGKIGAAATPITGGAVTITQSGSAAGDIDSAIPSAANDVVEGQRLAVTVGGTNDAVVSAKFFFFITP